jgi:hypothetical protein
MANQRSSNVDYPIILRGYKVFGVSPSQPQGAIVDEKGAKHLEKYLRPVCGNWRTINITSRVQPCGSFEDRR